LFPVVINVLQYQECVTSMPMLCTELGSKYIVEQEYVRSKNVFDRRSLPST